MKSTEIFETTSVLYNGTSSSGTPILTDYDRDVIEQVIWLGVLPLSILGVITNIINIRVFIEQGIRNDSTNIGLVCLSVWDLLNSITLIPYSICYILRFTNGLAYDITCRAFAISFIYAHIAFQSTSAWTTVYVSLIRTCCVIFPLRVKLMFSPKTTIFFIAAVFAFFGTAQTTYGSFTVLEWQFHSGLNTTVAIVRDTPAAQAYVFYKVLLINQILPMAAIIIVSINTIILGRKLLEVKKWRQKNSSGSASEAKQDDKKPLASKEIELIKFINTLTSIFLFCILISFLPSLPIMLLPGVDFTGLNYNLFFVIFWIQFVFDAINSSVNFFFYMRVSSRYKEAFASSFKRCLPKDLTES